MTSTDVDPRDPGRNLLFGLLAFQNNFIDRRALLAAFDAWTADKSRPIGQIFAKQGAIPEELHALIDGLVAAHLAKHHDEPARSLAALTPIGVVRQDLEALVDLETRASLLQVAADRAEFDPYATKAPSGDSPSASDPRSSIDPNVTNFPSVGIASSSGVRFQVLRPLNQGGMGVRADHCFTIPSESKSGRTCAALRLRASATLTTPRQRRNPIAALRNAAMIWGAAPDLIRLASSPIETSRT